MGMVLLVSLSGGCSEKDNSAPSVIAPFPTTATQSREPSTEDTEAPRVIDTFPPNGAEDVDPALTEISVTFNEEMNDGSWSWAYKDPTKVPEMPADPYYTEQNRRNVLPVRLKPNTEYEFWINTRKFNYFRDKNGNSAVPYEFRFKTGD